MCFSYFLILPTQFFHLNAGFLTVETDRIVSTTYLPGATQAIELSIPRVFSTGLYARFFTNECLKEFSRVLNLISSYGCIENITASFWMINLIKNVLRIHSWSTSFLQYINHFICNIAIMHLTLISALNLIGFLICGHIIDFLLNWNLILKILGFGLGKGLLVLIPETYYLSQPFKQL